MKNHPILDKLILSTIFLTFFIGTTSCVRNSSRGPQAWVDTPRGGATFPLGTSIPVLSHAYAREGLAEIVLYVNGEAYQRTAPAESGVNFSDFSQEWLPSQPGTYSLQVRAYDLNGDTGNPATVTLNVVGEVVAEAAIPVDPATATYTPEVTDTPSVTPIISDTPTLTSTPTQTPPEVFCPPQVTAFQNSNCRSGPGSAYEITGSLSQADSSSVVGRNNDSSWWVIERPGGSGNCWIWAELVQLSSTECEIPIVAAPPLPPTDTPTPTSTPTATATTVDNQPPPIPSPQQPANGANLSCRSSVTLSWGAVSDPSGIAGYYVKLEREVSAGNWQSAGGWGPLSQPQVDVPIDCGIRYRWMVRAEDGAGNISNWSSPSIFGMNLD